MNLVEKKEGKTAILFLLPSFIGFLLFMVYPMVFSVYLSLSDWSFFSGFSGIEFVGLKNYKALGDDYYFLSSLKNNMMLTLMSIPLTIILSLVLAVLLTQDVYFKGVVRTLIFMPYVSTLVAVAIVFGALYQPEYGPINSFLRSIGVQNPPGWLADVKWALPSISFLWTWKYLGYMAVIFMSGLQAIPRTYYEAAKIDGAGPLRQFRMITWPLVSPTTFFLVITGVMASLRIFPEIKILTEGGPGSSTYTMVYHIYTQAFELFRMGSAATLALVFFVITTIITLIQWGLQKKWVNYL